MTAFIAVALALVAAVGTAVVGTASPERQAVSLSVFGLTLTVLFAALQAPDVALSQLGIGAVVVPLMVMLAIHRIHRDRQGLDRQGPARGGRTGTGPEAG